MQINQLRSLLGSGYIATRDGRGYQFVAEVRRTPSRALPVKPEPQRGNLPRVWTSRADEGLARLIGRRDNLCTIPELLTEARLVT
ncbi:MAG TPA: hypothetical protein VIY09_06610 [Rhizomicrobium sp.]